MARQNNKVKKRELRILWSSNAPWSQSGYGVFTGDLAKRLHKDGWPIAISCFYGLQGNPIDWNGIRCYSVMNDPYGADAWFITPQTLRLT